MNVLVLTLACRATGRGKALLACCDQLAEVADVTIMAGQETGPRSALESYHGFLPAVEWHCVEWTGDVAVAIDEQIAATDPDVVIAWDDPLYPYLAEVDRPTVAWVESAYATTVDECWSPSRTAAESCRDALQAREVDPPTVETMYPHWYVQPATDVPGLDERPIDVLVHGRKDRGATTEFDGYSIVRTGDYSAAALETLYRRTKLFLFPRPRRAEPLGLMPIEAAAQGCRIAVPTNSGVAELFPAHAYEQPTEQVDRLLDTPTDVPDVPRPTMNPVARVEALA